MDSRPLRKGWLLGILGAAVIALLVAGGAIFLGSISEDGEDSTVAGIKPGFSFEKAPTPDPALVRDLERITAGLPAASGGTDRDRIASMLGTPDSFAISFELADGGKSEAPVRFETWFYFELQTTFDFSDGNLVSNLPVDDVPAFSLLPRQYEPAMFQAGMSFEEVSALVASPGDFARLQAPPEFGVNVTAYYGEQLFLAFESGRLVYVETFVLAGGVQ